MELKELLDKAFTKTVKDFLEATAKKTDIDKEKLEKALIAFLLLEFENQLKNGNTPIGFSIVGKGVSATSFFAPGGFILKAIINRAIDNFQIPARYMDKEALNKLKGEEREALEFFFKAVDGIIVYTVEEDVVFINNREKEEKILAVYMTAWGELAKQFLPLPISIPPLFPKPNQN